MSRLGWKQLLYIVPIIIAVLLLTNRQIEPISQPQQATADKMESDYYLRGVHISHIGSDGKIDEEIFAELLTHYPHDNHSDLTVPRFKLHQKNGGNLWAESKKGVIYGEERVLLKQDVSIEERTADNTLTNHIKSSEIEIERATRKMTSRKQVTITGENYTIVAGAMELLSNERQLYLSGGVKGHYEP